MPHIYWHSLKSAHFLTEHDPHASSKIFLASSQGRFTPKSEIIHGEGSEGQKPRENHKRVGAFR